MTNMDKLILSPAYLISGDWARFKQNWDQLQALKLDKITSESCGGGQRVKSWNLVVICRALMHVMGINLVIGILIHFQLKLTESVLVPISP